jgi:hypothetical protein
MCDEQVPDLQKILLSLATSAKSYSAENQRNISFSEGKLGEYSVLVCTCIEDVLGMNFTSGSDISTFIFPHLLRVNTKMVH